MRTTRQNGKPAEQCVGGLLSIPWAGAGVFAILGCCMSACGSSDSGTQPGMTCGPGTVGVGGQCQTIPVDASTGGSGGSAGAGGNAAGNGGGGGTGQGGGSGDGGATGGTGGEDGGDASSEAEPAEGGNDAISDVHNEGDPWPGDDPCPTAPFFVNCSDSCGSQSDCATKGCEQGSFLDVYKEQLPMVLRTPSRPGWNSHCKFVCAFENPGAVPPSFGYVFHYVVHFDPPAGTHLRLSVGAPWTIRESTKYMDICWPSPTPTSCVLAPLGGESAVTIIIETSDPDAPARNVVIELAPPASEECP